MMKTLCAAALITCSPALFASPGETYRFEIELNQQMCSRPDEADFLCSSDANKSLIEVVLDRVKPTDLEDRAWEGNSEPMGLALNSSVQYRPTLSIRKSIIGKVSMYTVRFRSTRNSDDAKAFETIYIEEGETLALRRPLTLMADRFGNGVRFFRQVYINLARLPEAVGPAHL
jgi:hypothetical protein